jgi:hypothetical protein
MSDFGQMEQKFDRNGGLVEFGDDARLFVVFYSRSVRDEIQSREANRPVNVLVDYVRIRQPGERDEIDRPAHRGDQQRFARHWAAYQEGRQELPAGTPLSILFPNNPEVVENLKYDKIFVVEQLAALNDTQIGNIGLGGRQFVDKAKAFLAAASNGKGLQELFAEVDQLAAGLKAKDERIKALETALEASNKKRGKEAA